MATRFITAQCVITLLDPVFYLCPVIVDLDHFLYRKLGVGYNEPDLGKSSFLMPPNPAHHSTEFLTASWRKKSSNFRKKEVIFDSG